MLKRAFLFFGVIGLTASLSWRSYSAEPSEHVRELRNPSAPGSLAPGLFASPDGALILTWIETAGTSKALKYASWDGNAWTKPATVLSQSDLQPDSAAPPIVLKLKNGSLIAVWSEIVRSRGKEEGNFLFASASSNSGKNWSTPVRIHSDQGISEHSYSSIAATGAGQATLIWLDSRDYDTKHRYRLMSVTIESDGKLGEEKTIDQDTCTCCPTAFVKTTTGALAAYRGHNPEEIRDIKVARLKDGTWQTPHTVHDDVWKINGCPVNGPALASSGKNVGVVWFTGSNDKPEVKFALSNDQGATFQAPITLDSSNGENRPVGHVAVSLLEDGSTVAIWLHHETSGTDLVGERISPSGQRSGTFIVARGTETSLGYPRAQRLENQLVVSWGGKPGKGIKTTVVKEE